MKISEITNKNLSWFTLNGVDITDVKSSYNSLITALAVVTRLKSPSRSKIILGNVEEFTSTIDKILDINYPDKDDTDIVQLTKELIQMKNHVLNLSSQLKL